MIDAQYNVVNPIVEVRPGEVFREYLDSNCWNQMDFSRRMGIAPITKSEFATPVRRGVSEKEILGLLKKLGSMEPEIPYWRIAETKAFTS